MIKIQLNFLIQLVNDLRNNNSSNEKKLILKKYYDLEPTLFNKFMDYIYSYDKKFWLTSDNIEKLKDKFTTKYTFAETDNIFIVLDKLVLREITGHDAINYVQDLIIFLGEEYKDIIYSIINKDLKANANVSLINNISHNAVKEFKVALAQRNDEAPAIHQVSFESQKWMISRKLDGVRTICILNNGIPEFFSRTGTQFQTLSNLNEQATKVLNLAKQMYGEEFVLDGECCLYDENGNDDFNGIMKEITRKNHTIANPKYVIFDLIKKSEFDNSLGTTKFGERIEMLEKLNVEQFGNNILTIPHANTISKQTYDEWLETCRNKGWEGLMLRDEESVYTGKRSFDLQKIKAFHDAEYKVIGLEEGNKKMLVNGVMQETQCVKSLVIEHKGAHVNVGSGISDEERVLWLKDPTLIMDKIITVQYFEESVDSKTGQLSLRFPTLKIVHGSERNT